MRGNDDLTPLDVFQANLPSKRRAGCVVLVATGSLNPVHVMHVRMLELAAAKVCNVSSLSHAVF
jgi:hypothetical protein